MDLQDLLAPNENVVAYAACWLHSDVARRAVFEFGTDDGNKVWLNGKLLAGKAGDRALARGEEVVPVLLRRGGNEVLLKVVNGKSNWGFCFEVFDPQGRSLLQKLKVSTTPPAGRR